MLINIDINLDHVGLACYDIESTVAAFANLGFYVGNLQSINVAGGRGNRNSHFVFNSSYIEVIEHKDNDHLSNYIQDIHNIHIIAIATHDAQKKYAELLSKGHNVLPPTMASREAKHGKQQGEASFLWFPYHHLATNGYLLCYVEHKNRELIFQKEPFIHQNTLIDIDSLYFCAKDKYELNNFLNIWHELENSEFSNSHLICGLKQDFAHMFDFEVEHGFFAMKLKCNNYKSFISSKNGATMSFRLDDDEVLWVDKSITKSCHMGFYFLKK